MKKINGLILAFAAFLTIGVLFQNCAPSLEDVDTSTLNSGNSDDNNPPPSNAPIANSYPSSPLYIVAGSQLQIPITFFGSNLSYQWYKNDVPISGAVTDTYNGGIATVADSGSYKIEAWEPNTARGSHTIDVVVSDPNLPTPTLPPGVSPTPPGNGLGAPTIVSPVSSNTIHYVLTNGVAYFVNPAFLVGGGPTYPDYNMVQFQVVASGSNLNYQWFHQSVGGTTTFDIPGATTSSYSFRANSITDARIYGVRVSNSNGTTISQGLLDFYNSQGTSGSSTVFGSTNNGNASFTSTCPAGQIFMGFNGHQNGGELTALQPRCGNPNFVGNANRAGSTDLANSVSISCDPGSYMFGVNVRTSLSKVISVQGRCGDKVGNLISTTGWAGSASSGSLATFNCPRGFALNSISGRLESLVVPGNTITYFRKLQFHCAIVVP